MNPKEANACKLLKQLKQSLEVPHEYKKHLDDIYSKLCDATDGTTSTLGATDETTSTLGATDSECHGKASCTLPGCTSYIQGICPHCWDVDCPTPT